MIRVEILEVSEDNFGRVLVEQMAESLRDELSDLRCAKHGEPSIVIMVKGEEIGIDACCDDVHDLLIARIEELMGDTHDG